jgi:predicted Rossmann fold nucleotide-binding protein DprA/Smf involved in DNA uptake
MRIPAGWMTALLESRLLVFSPFIREPRRATSESAMVRNEFVAGLADEILVPHAAPGSKTEAHCARLAGEQKRVSYIHQPP